MHRTKRVTVEDAFVGPLDAMAYPPRQFHFVLSSTDQGVVETDDDRPWLGVVAEPLGWPADWTPESSLVVKEVVADSPALGKLFPGDIITGVDSGSAPDNAAQADNSGVASAMEKFVAGSIITLQVERGERQIEVSAQLGSVLDDSAKKVGAGSWYVLSTD